MCTPETTWALPGPASSLPASQEPARPASFLFRDQEGIGTWLGATELGPPLLPVSSIFLRQVQLFCAVFLPIRWGQQCPPQRAAARPAREACDGRGLA